MVQDQPRQKAHETPPSQVMAGSGVPCLSSQLLWGKKIFVQVYLDIKQDLSQK
jgi:hypothetical protein